MKGYPTIEEIVKAYLEQNGYDGLWDVYGCGCDLDDFMPCEEPHVDCKAGYRVKGGIGRRNKGKD